MTNRSVLIVIDNISERAIIAGELENVFKIKEVHQTHTGKNGLKYLRNLKHVDLIICDTELPDMDGFSFIKQCKKDPNGAIAPYVLTSAKKDRPTLLQAASVGVNEYIVKPYSGRIIQHKIGKILNQKILRSHKRVSLFEAVNLTLQFKEKQTEGCILDLSLGGCQISTPLFGPGDATIYDEIQLNFKNEKLKFEVKSRLVRTEKHQESSSTSGQLMKAAFEFIDVDKNTLASLSQLMSLSNSPT